MRSFHESEGLAPPTQKLLLPENIVLLATHGSREVPSHFVLSEAFSDPHYGDPRLKDFPITPPVLSRNILMGGLLSRPSLRSHRR
jgi:hypothetical protein